MVHHGTVEKTAANVRSLRMQFQRPVASANLAANEAPEAVEKHIEKLPQPRSETAKPANSQRIEYQTLSSPVLSLPSFPYTSLIQPSASLELPEMSRQAAMEVDVNGLNAAKQSMEGKKKSEENVGQKMKMESDGANRPVEMGPIQIEKRQKQQERSSKQVEKGPILVEKDSKQPERSLTQSSLLPIETNTVNTELNVRNTEPNAKNTEPYARNTEPNAFSIPLEEASPHSTPVQAHKESANLPEVESELHLQRGKPIAMKKAGLWRVMMEQHRKENEESEYELEEGEEENHDDLIVNEDYIEVENEMTFLKENQEEKQSDQESVHLVEDEPFSEEIISEPVKPKRRRRRKSAQTTRNEGYNVETAPKRVRTQNKSRSRTNTSKNTKPTGTRRARSKFNYESDFTNSFGASIIYDEDNTTKDVTEECSNEVANLVETADSTNDFALKTSDAIQNNPKKRIRRQKISDGKKWLDYLTKLDEEKERKQRQSEMEYIRKRKLREERYREQQMKRVRFRAKFSKE